MATILDTMFGSGGAAIFGLMFESEVVEPALDLLGEITESDVTESGFTFDWPAATGPVSGYDSSIDAGVTWLDMGMERTRTVINRAAATPHPVRARAHALDGTVSAALSKTITTLEAAVQTPDGVISAPTTGLYAARTYTWLLAEVARWIKRTNMTAEIPGFIMLAEAEINRKLGVGPREVDVELAMTPGSRYVRRPADMSYPIALWNGHTQPREELTPSLAATLPVDATTSGAPVYWAIDGYAIAFDKKADLAYPLTFRYMRDTTLSETNQTNELLVRSPDLYLYGALSQAAPYMRDDARIGLWKTEFQRILRQVHAEASRTKSRAPLRTEFPFGGG